MSEKYTPTKDELRSWIAGPEFAGGITNDELGEQFDRAIAKIEADAVREFMEDQVVYARGALQRYADKIEEDAG